jgi:anaerobic magnesium-protoporphyrin IX monomethyl ester cyclase
MPVPIKKTTLKILIINPAHKSIGSRMAKEHLPPLGLLSIAGPIIDSRYDVSLLDADYSNLSVKKTVEESKKMAPNIILMGHSGSTSAQPAINELSIKLKESIKNLIIIIGGVFPTYHWKEIMENQSCIDFIVCGEGEQVTLDLINAISNRQAVEKVDGIVFRDYKEIIKTKTAKIIDNLDDYRIAWELMNGYNYTYWGKKIAVVLQFSRGCPYPCNYCGQSLFWRKWRNRNPQKLADEIEMLHREYGVKVINFADENPSTNKAAWKELLEAIIEKNLDLILVGSIRADNVVRDEGHLHLYKKAGFERLLLGIENYSEVILEKIRKSGSKAKDQRAIELLRKHDILSMATYVVGFGEESIKDFYSSLRQLLAYDPDQVQILYATPHKWTPYFKEIEHKTIIQSDQQHWDYKHQILENPKLKPWQIFLLVKLIEVIMQARLKAIKRWLFHRDKRLRSAMFWYNNIGKSVWFFQLFQFFFVYKRPNTPLMLRDFWK